MTTDKFEIKFSKKRAMIVSALFIFLFLFFLYQVVFHFSYLEQKFLDKPLGFFAVFVGIIWAYPLGLYACFPIMIARDPSILLDDRKITYLGDIHPKIVVDHRITKLGSSGKFLIVQFADRSTEKYSMAYEIR